MHDVELRIPQGVNGVRMVVERFGSDFSNANVCGVWKEHSLLGSQVDLASNDRNPDQGAIGVSDYAFGTSTGVNPTLDDSAVWTGKAIARDATVTESLESVVQGEAGVSVDLRQMDGLQADVGFTRLFNRYRGELHDDIAWASLPVTEGGFAEGAADNGRIAGRFLEPEQEEVVGTFERNGLSGVFGRGAREEAVPTCGEAGEPVKRDAGHLVRTPPTACRSDSLRPRAIEFSETDSTLVVLNMREASMIEGSAQIVSSIWLVFFSLRLGQATNKLASVAEATAPLRYRSQVAIEWDLV